jgi:biotin carboxyl carrier protein
MKPIRWLAGAALFALLAWALVFAYRKGRAERQSEVQREAPVIAPSRVAAGDDGVVVRLDPAESGRLGLVTEPARSVSAAATVQLNGVIVPDSARIAFLRAPVAGRLEAAPGAAWPELGARVAAGATIAQVADAKALVLPRAGVVTQVGARPGEIVQPGQVLLAISDLTEPLARIAWTDGAPATPPGRLTVQPLDQSGRSASALLVGPAFDVDPLTQRPAFNYRLTHSWPGLAVGLPVAASVPTGPSEGGAIRVPAAAVVQWEGLLWAYVERAPGQFSRVRVRTTTALPGGWAMRGGIKPGDRIVTAGAEQLLSEEFRAQVQVGDEVAE